jgi:hypothetical protein
MRAYALLRLLGNFHGSAMRLFAQIDGLVCPLVRMPWKPFLKNTFYIFLDMLF